MTPQEKQIEAYVETIAELNREVARLNWELKEKASATGRLLVEMDSLKNIYSIEKRGKFLRGHGYSTHFGYQFKWTIDINKARRFDMSQAKNMVFYSKGKIIRNENRNN